MKRLVTLAMLATLMIGAGATGPITICTRAGQQFTVVVGSNPTTGYGWQLNGRLNGKIVRFLKSRYEAPAVNRVGAGGREIWTFQAVGRGKTRLSLKYVRSWEKQTPPARISNYEVNVK